MRISLILFCLAFLFPAADLWSQGKPLSFGIHAGANFASVNPDPGDSFDPKFRTGFFAGANLRWAFAEKFSLPVEVQFSQRGFYYNTAGTFIEDENGALALYRGRIDSRLRYLDLAPQIEFNPIPALGIAVGPYLSYRLGESVQYGEVIDWTDTKDSELYKDTDFGLTAKISGNVGPVFVFAGYQLGLANISNIMLTDSNGLPVGELSLKNRAFLLGAGWRI